MRAMNIFNLLTFFGLIFLFLSCRGEDSFEGQKIDQVVQIYLKSSSGENLLDPNREPVYSVSFIDLDAERAGVSVSTQKKQDSINGFYLEYVAGAARIEEAFPGGESGYRSTLQMISRDGVESVEEIDTLVLRYSSTPEEFTIQQILLNDTLRFQRSGQTLNQIILTK